MNDVSSLAEAFDSCEDVVGTLGPSEGLGIGVVGVEVGCDGRLQFRGRLVCAAPDLIVGDQAKEALDLIDPGRRSLRIVHMPEGALGEPVADRLGRGSNIGYRSIVSRAIPANGVAGGSPARASKSGITWDHGLLWLWITSDNPCGGHRLMASRARAPADKGYGIKPFQTPYSHGRYSSPVIDPKERAP